MIGTIHNTDCVHGKKLMDCQKCLDPENFNTDLDDETGPAPWLLELDDLPLCPGKFGEEVQIEDEDGIFAIVEDEIYEGFIEWQMNC